MKFKCLTNLNICCSLFSCVLKTLSRNEDVENDMMVENSMRSLFDIRCLKDCRLHVLNAINEMLKCVDQQNLIQRDQNSKRDVLNIKDDLFLPVRGGISGWAPIRITAEKKGPLDILANDLFVPTRGRRQMNRKYFSRMDRNPFSDAIEQNDRDYFVPNRGKRQQNHIVDEVSKSGMKVIIPKSHTPFERDPWLFRNINSDDRNMIDLLEDLNQPGIEVNTDENEKEIHKERNKTQKRVHKNCKSLCFVVFITVNSLSSQRGSLCALTKL